MPDPVEMSVIVGANSAEDLISTIIDLCHNVEEVKQIQKTVIIDNCKVQTNKVIVDGRLRKDILFKVLEHGHAPTVPGNVQGISGIVNHNQGRLAATDVDIAFTMLVPVPGARPGDRCEVIHAFVEGEKEEPANLGADGLFTAIIDKSVVFVCLKVLRPGARGTVTAVAEAALCGPVTTSGTIIGAPPGTIPFAEPGLVRGTWIGPTVTFPGFINPGRPSRLPLTNPALASNQSSQIQVTGTPVSGTGAPITATTTTMAGAAGLPAGITPGAGGVVGA